MFAPTTFPDQFNAFLDRLMPDDDALMTVDGMTYHLRAIRQYLIEQQVPRMIATWY